MLISVFFSNSFGNRIDRTGPIYTDAAFVLLKAGNKKDKTSYQYCPHPFKALLHYKAILNLYFNYWQLYFFQQLFQMNIFNSQDPGLIKFVINEHTFATG